MSAQRKNMSHYNKPVALHFIMKNQFIVLLKKQYPLQVHLLSEWSFWPYHMVFISRQSLLSCHETVDLQTVHFSKHFKDFSSMFALKLSRIAFFDLGNSSWMMANENESFWWKKHIYCVVEKLHSRSGFFLGLSPPTKLYLLVKTVW